MSASGLFVSFITYRLRVFAVGDDAGLRHGVAAVGIGEDRGGAVEHELVDLGGELVLAG